jgi:uncharacterized protein (TIGR02145 family)
MNLIRILLFFAFAFMINSTYAQNLMNIHQGNGTLLQIPLESIDSVRFYTIPPPTIQKIFQSNGNILSVAVSDIDSITYTIPNSAALASISTQTVTVLSSSSAYSGGTITSDGGSAITQRGVCWSNSPNPTLANNFSFDGTGIGSFGSSISPLQPATTYYVRSYAVNSEGTAYGNQLTFTTSNPSTSGILATITTANVIYTDGLTASCGGNITADGGLAVTSRGVCWAIGTTPTIDNSISVDGSGGGSYTSTLINLLPNTSYFVRAFATNDAGTAYGITFNFSTFALPTVITDSIYSIVCTSALCRGNIISNGGSNIIQKGVCWSIQPNPTITDNVSVLNQVMIGTFNRYISDLFSSTTYYVRTFATNSVGTSYGNELSFTTLGGDGGTEIISNPGAGVAFNGYSYSSIVLGNGQEWMAENLRTANYRNGDPIPSFIVNAPSNWGLFSGAYCIYNNDPSNEAIYGKLYNWYAVADPRNVCPAGWHVPTDLNWLDLINYLGVPCAAGGKMKSTGTQYWQSPNTDATNESGFSGLPGGHVTGAGQFFSIGGEGRWWGSTITQPSWSDECVLSSNNSNAGLTENTIDAGLSVRCLKD